MTEPLPALCLIAMPGRRRRTIELGQEAERRGFAGLYVPSPTGGMSPGEALAWNTASITFATAIAPIYQRTIVDFAQSAAMMHEVSGGRFRLGIGIAHGPSYVRMGVTPGKPLADTRAFIGNMIPTCISDDVEAARAVNRRTLTNYAFLPNYRNYWKEAGYVEEMAAIEKAIADGRRDDVPKYLTDKWLADNTLFGPAAKVRDGLAAWRAAGVHTPILVPSSAAGNQMSAIDEVFAAF